MKIDNVNQGMAASRVDKNNDIINNKPEVSNQKEVKTEEQDNTVLANDAEMDADFVKRSIEQANKSLKHHNRVIERNIHEKTKAVMYTVKDTDTNEVIAEFPPKKIQDMIAKMWELAGLFVDEKA